MKDKKKASKQLAIAELMSQTLTLIQTSLQNHVVEPERLRMIGLGPNVTYDTVLLFLSDSWEEYGFNDEQAVASIPLNSWLDGIDQATAELTTNPLAVIEQRAIQDLTEMIEQSLMQIAVQPNLLALENPVALFIRGLPLEGYERMVAFSHPHGDLPLLPLRETRQSYSSLYPYGILHSDGLTLFYPKNKDEDDLDADASDTADSTESRYTQTQTYLFSQMELLYLYGENGIAFRLKGNSFDHHIEPGHAYPEHGDSTREKITQRLRDHAKAQTNLYFDINQPPDPRDSEAFVRWQTLYHLSGDNSPGDVLHLLAERYDLDTAIAFAQAQPRHSKWRGKTLAYLVDVLADAGQWERALGFAQQVQGTDRDWLHDSEARLLLMLRRYDAAMQAAQELIDKDDNFLRPMGWVIRILCMDYLGQDHKAEKEAHLFVEKFPDTAAAYYALAHTLRLRNPQQAAEYFLQATGKQRFTASYASIDFADCAPVMHWVVRRNTLLQQNNQQAADLAQRRQTIDAAYMVVDVQSWLDRSSTYWNTTATLPEQDTPGISAAYQLVGQQYLVSTFGRKYEWIAFDNGNKPVCMPTGLEQNALAFTVFNGYGLIANANEGLCIFKPGTNPLHHTITPSMFDGSCDGITAAEGVIAIARNNCVELYDATNFTAPQHSGMLDFRSDKLPGASVKGIMIFTAMNKRFIAVAAGNVGLVIADITDLDQPRIVTVLGGRTPEGELFCSKRILRYRHWLFLDDDHNTTWLVNIENPEVPKSEGLLPLKHSGTELWEEDQGLLLCYEKHLWRLHTSAENTLEVVGITHCPTCNDPRIKMGNYLFSSNDDGEGIFISEQALPITSWQGEAQIHALQPRLAQWIDAQLETMLQHSPDYAIGLVRLAFQYNNFCLVLEQERTPIRLRSGYPIPEKPIIFTIELEAFAGSMCPEAIPDDLPEVVLSRLNNKQSAAYQILVRTALDNLAHDSCWQTLAGGRLMLAMQLNQDGALDIINTQYFHDRPYRPYRCSKAGLASVDVAQWLTADDGYQHLDRVEQLAQHDPQILKAILQVAEEGYVWGLVAARNLENLDPTAVLQCFITAGEAGHMDEVLVDFLSEHRKHSKVDTILEAAYVHQDAEIMVCAARALDRLESECVKNHVCELLQSKYPGPHDQAVDILKDFTAPIDEFIEPLVAAINTRPSHTDTIAGLATQLMRTAYSTPPEGLLSMASEDKKYEDSGDKEYASCNVARCWLGRIFADRLTLLSASNDRTSPLWLTEYDPEPYPQSWRHFINAAWPLLEEKGEQVLCFFLETLTVHTEANPLWDNDRAMMTSVLGYAVNQPTWLREAIQLAQAMLAGNAATNKRQRAFAQQIVSHELLNKAREYRDAGAWDKAHDIIDPLIQAVPNDPQILMAEAILISKEQGAEAALHRLDETLPRIGSVHAPHPNTGRAQLLNVYGCLLDQLQRWEQAKDWFLKAQAEDPAQPIYHANAAEVFDKLGDHDNAVKWAHSARAAGSQSTIVAAILQREENR